MISRGLNVDKKYVHEIAINSNKYYKHFRIKKYDGKYRSIYHPSPILKALQYWLVHNIFYRFPISEYSYAYKVGSSIKKNALIHVQSNHFLHIDVKNYFESINHKHIVSLFEKNKQIIQELSLDEDDIALISKICLFDGHLTIGSVSSPIISNCVMNDFDLEIRGLLPHNILYTRYADDMVLSSKTYIQKNIIELVKSALKNYDLRVNNTKTRFMSKGSRIVVTGLILDRDRVTIGIKRRKDIKKMLYEKLKYGKGNSREILGHLFFLKDIEPEYFDMLMVKYSIYGNVLEILKDDTKIYYDEKNQSKLQVAASKGN